MNLVDTPPARWDERIEFPMQSAGYAQAATPLGHRPLFAEDERGIALVRLVGGHRPARYLNALAAPARALSHQERS
jgi:hypothetical protein